MIPNNIEQDHILSAIHMIDERGYANSRTSEDFDLYFNGKFYPPKVVISYANIFANGEEWPAGNFNGGVETNRYLINNGFPITRNVKKNPEYRFSVEDLWFFDKYAQQPYNHLDEIQVNAGDYINQYIWGKSREWADRISAVTAFKREGRINWNEQRNSQWKQSFKNYSWYRLHHQEHYHQQIFYTVGIEGPRSQEYNRSHLVIKLDCRRPRQKATYVQVFDTLLKQHGIDWKIIPIPNDSEEEPWEDLVSQSLDYINTTFHVYLEAIRGIIQSTREMAARITWNDRDWIEPSGREGKSTSHATSHEKLHGYTPEEWLFDIEKLIDGYHYARMESLNSPHHLGQLYNLTLFTKDARASDWAWVARISDAEVISEEQSIMAAVEYRKNGWLQEQIEQLQRLPEVNATDYIDRADGERFNVRFKPENIVLYNLVPFSEDEQPPSLHYNLPGLKQQPAFLNEHSQNILKEDELVHGSTDETDPEGKFTRHYKPQLKELDNVHGLLQTRFAKYLRSNRPTTHHIFTESRRRLERTRVDIEEVTATGSRIFYEVKTYPSSRHSIRVAIGQLFEYAYFPSHSLTDEFVIVSHIPATPQERQYLKYLSGKLGINVSYIAFDYKGEHLIDETSDKN